MKKTIAMVGVFALALSAAGAASAGNDIFIKNVDDAVMNQQERSVKNERFFNHSIYKGESALIFNLNTGKNTTAAAGDVEQNYQEGTGGVTLNVTRNSDINSGDISSDCDCDGSSDDEDNKLVAEESDDFITNQQKDEESNFEAEDISVLEESEYAEVNVNTGENSVLAGEDVEEEDDDEPDAVGEENSGDINVTWTENKFRNFKVLRRGM